MAMVYRYIAYTWLLSYSEDVFFVFIGQNMFHQYIGHFINISDTRRHQLNIANK